MRIQKITFWMRVFCVVVHISGIWFQQSCWEQFKCERKWCGRSNLVIYSIFIFNWKSCSFLFFASLTYIVHNIVQLSRYTLIVYRIQKLAFDGWKTFTIILGHKWISILKAIYDIDIYNDANSDFGFVYFSVFRSFLVESRQCIFQKSIDSYVEYIAIDFLLDNRPLIENLVYWLSTSSQSTINTTHSGTYMLVICICRKLLFVRYGQGKIGCEKLERDVRQKQVI